MYSNSSIENGWTDFDEIFCECSSSFLDGLDSQLDPVGGAQTGNLRFTMEIVVYKWLILVIGEISIYYFIGCHWLSGTSIHQVEFSHIACKGG